MSSEKSPRAGKDEHGLKPGEVPSAWHWPVDLWIALPPSSTAPIDRLVARVLHAIGETGPIKSTTIRATWEREPGKERFAVVKAEDVARLYRRMHRARVGVVALGGMRVRKNPIERATRRGSVPLSDFVAHKAFYRVLTREGEVPDCASDFRHWTLSTLCEGQGDPRCLPRQVFRDDSKLPLDAEAERSHFEDVYKGRTRSGGHPSRLDAAGRTWQRGAFHTLDLLQVAGQTLPVGMHWDVQFHRGGEVSNGWEVWHFPGGTYGNVHPDAFLRGKQGTKLHDATAPHLDEDKHSPRAPLATRRRGARSSSRKRR